MLLQYASDVMMKTLELLFTQPLTMVIVTEDDYYEL